MSKKKKTAKKRLKEVETQRINNKMIKIEEMKNDSSRYFAALKEVQSERKQENLVVEDKNKKIAATEEEQVKIVSEYFKKMLAPGEKIVTYLNFHHTKWLPHLQLMRSPKLLRN